MGYVSFLEGTLQVSRILEAHRGYVFCCENVESLWLGCDWVFWGGAVNQNLLVKWFGMGKNGS